MWEVRSTGRELYAQFGERGSVFVIEPDGAVTEQLRDVAMIEPMVPLDDAVSATLELIREVPLSRAVRKALAEKLGVEMEDVGTTPRQRISS